MLLKNLVVLSGAGISAESGISTFRDAGGLWEGHRIEDVASPEAWRRDPQLVLDFYNKRRAQLGEVRPNRAHELLSELEQHYRVQVITQNVDDLHERAGNSHVLHLHGELKYGRSTSDPGRRYFLDTKAIALGQCCELGSQIRPDIVWFGEPVPMIEVAISHAQKADVFLVLGTSLEVYPAAGLLDFVPYDKPIFVIDPVRHGSLMAGNITRIQQKAVAGMGQLFPTLVNLATQ